MEDCFALMVNGMGHLFDMADVLLSGLGPDADAYSCAHEGCSKHFFSIFSA